MNDIKIITLAKTLAYILFIAIGIQWCRADSVRQVSSDGITWTFDKTCEVGQFINGDWWVKGPATIVSISPEASEGRNGSMINPKTFKQAYDSRVANYDPNLAVVYPVTLQPGQSLVSTQSYDGIPNCNQRKSSAGKRDLMGRCVAAAHSSIDSARVLTAVENPVPPTTFRPPFVGDDKPLYDKSDLRTDLLPKLGSVPRRISPLTYARYFRFPWLNQNRDWQGRVMHPRENQPNYYREAYMIYGEATLLLMLDIPNTDELLINYIQTGIDAAYSVKRKLGDRQTSKWPIIFAGILLDKPELFTQAYGRYREITQTYYGSNGKPYWRQKPGLEYEQVDQADWKNFDKYPQFYNAGGSQGGYKLENYRNCCSSSTWPAIALSAMLLPGGKQAYNHDAFFDYVDRWMQETGNTSALSKAMWDQYRNGLSPTLTEPHISSNLNIE